MMLLDSQASAPGGINRWLNSFPPDSIRRLHQINASSGSARHVILALAFGSFDKHIRDVNRLITGLLVARLKASRQGDLEKVSRINLIMEELHNQIDRLTGVVHHRVTPCNRPSTAVAGTQA